MRSRTEATSTEIIRATEKSFKDAFDKEINNTTSKPWIQCDRVISEGCSHLTASCSSRQKRSTYRLNEDETAMPLQLDHMDAIGRDLGRRLAATINESDRRMFANLDVIKDPSQQTVSDENGDNVRAYGPDRYIACPRGADARWKGISEEDAARWRSIKNVELIYGDKLDSYDRIMRERELAAEAELEAKHRESQVRLTKEAAKRERDEAARVAQEKKDQAAREKQDFYTGEESFGLF